MKPRILIYVNSHIAHHLDKSVMKKYLNKEIGHKNWEYFGDIMIPPLLKEDIDYMTDNFFHGISAHQYTMIQNGGTFINPMLYGLNSNFSLWNDILHERPKFVQEVLYIDVPYEIYKEVVGEDDIYFVDRDTYNDMSSSICEMVDRMKATYYKAPTEALH